VSKEVTQSVTIREGTLYDELEQLAHLLIESSPEKIALADLKRE
jgi:hypothetical protein